MERDFNLSENNGSRPPEPEGNPGDWRYLLNNGWTLTLQGTQNGDIATPTEYRAFLDPPEYRNFELEGTIPEHWKFDQAGRPRVHLITTTTDGQYERIGLLEQGAPARAAANPENLINKTQYDALRIQTVRLGPGLAIFGEYITSNVCSNNELRLLIRKIRPSILDELTENPNVLQYLRDTLLLLGREYYDTANQDRTSNGSTYEKIDEKNGKKDRTIDDALGEVLKIEKKYHKYVRVCGRAIIGEILASFEYGSPNDIAWQEANPKLIDYEMKAQRMLRQEYGQRGYLSPSVARALRLPQALGISEDRIEGGEHLFIVNPWKEPRIDDGENL